MYVHMHTCCIYTRSYMPRTGFVLVVGDHLTTVTSLAVADGLVFAASSESCIIV